jgi:hypothetical protein
VGAEEHPGRYDKHVDDGMLEALREERDEFRELEAFERRIG